MSAGIAATQRFGIYEKALAPGTWREMLQSAKDAGFDYVEMSIDESDERLARLDWSAGQRAEVVAAIREIGIPIYSICLSAHRRFGLGSADAAIRQKALDLLDSAIELAAELGVRVVQIAGYHAYYETDDTHTNDRYVEGLIQGAQTAAKRGVMLGVENIDTLDLASAEDVLTLVSDVHSPWFQAYPDVGNLAVHELPVAENVARVLPHAVGLHLKDARKGEPRRVPFGSGTVPFADVFTAVAESGYTGPMTLEMWNDDPRTAVATATEALAWIKERMK